MLLFLPLTFHFFGSTAVEEKTDAFESWLATPILEPETVRNEVGQFTLKRIPPLSAPETAEAWLAQANQLRERILNEVVFRGAPVDWSRQTTSVVWTGALETDKGYRIRKLRYEALPGLWMPALLYEPTEMDGKIPAVLNVNGHVGPPGKAIAYEQIRCINLAKQGVLALHPEWLVFGELQGFDYKHNRLAYLDLCGVSGLAVFYRAMQGGVDVLLSHPNTDPERVAMTGLSGGGWQTIILGALDTRLSLLAPIAGYIGLDQRVAHRSDIGDLEQNPTDLVSIADYTHLTAMLVPRPALLIYNEKDECCFVAERAKPSVFDPITPFYGLFNRTQNFEYYMNTDPGTHNYDRDNREQFYRFIHRHFTGKQISEEIPSDAEALNPDELAAGIPEGNADFFTLASNLLPSLPKHRPPEGNAAALKEWKEKARERLRDVLRLKKSMNATATVIQSASDGEREATWYRISVGDVWSAPAVVISKAAPKATAIVFADGGRARLSNFVRELVEADTQVIALDPLFMGECVPQGTPPFQYAMMISAVGERLLGIQVGQVDAVVKWARQEFDIAQVSLYTEGWTSGVVALAVAGLNPDCVEKVVAQNALSSLKQLIEAHLDYEQYPSLFCFGLLEQFDVAELEAMSK
jgi:dienelactone hydrolase